MEEEKRYRVVATRFAIEAIMEETEGFTTAANEDCIVISGTIQTIKTMLSAIGVDCSKLDEIN